MATEVKLPDLGEGIEDVTISRWLVGEGAEVKAGDVILEVATDKVDTEVPAPASGKVLKIHYAEGALAPLDAVLAVIGAAGEEAGGAPAPETAMPAKAAQTAAPAKPEPSASPGENGSAKASPVAKRVAADKGLDLETVPGTGPGGRITKGDVLASAEGHPVQEHPAPAFAQLGRPLPGDLANVPSLEVRREAALHNIDLEQVAEGRPLSSLTRYDVLNVVASQAAGKPVTVEPQYLAPEGGTATPAPAKPATRVETAVAPQPAAVPAIAPTEPGAGEALIKHTRMRQLIARNTAQSAFTAPHVTTMWDVNMAAPLAHRKAHKDEFAAAGVNLTVTAYLVQAIVAGLRAVPAANASYTDEGVILKRYYNIGLAVALPMDKNGLGGLIVPVIKHAEDLNLLGIARAVNELAEKARTNSLRPDDLQGGTFTLSNYGTSGSIFQTPVIVQPQAGILGVGAIEKRPVVVSQGHPLEANTGDYLAFLPMTTLGFSYDHRVLDGATADAFCAAVKSALEKWA